MDFFLEKTDGIILVMLCIFKLSLSKMSSLWGLAVFLLGVFNLPTAETYPHITSPFFLFVCDCRTALEGEWTLTVRINKSFQQVNTWKLGKNSTGND